MQNDEQLSIKFQQLSIQLSLQLMAASGILFDTEEETVSEPVLVVSSV